MISLCFALLSAVAVAHSNGARACDVGDTNQMGGPVTYINKWALKASSGYTPGRTIDITITNADSNTFKGLLIYAETEDGNRAGSFVGLEPGVMRYVFADLHCGPEKSTVTHVVPALKKAGYTLTW